MAAALVGLVAAGCSGPPASTEYELGAFREAGPIVPKLDREKLLEAEKPELKKKPVPGDLLRLSLPQVVATIENGPKPREKRPGRRLTRVQPDGTILVPILGPVDISGLTFLEVERKLSNAYYPEYIKPKPSIQVYVEEHHTEPVTIIGDVAEPGVYELRSDQMNLVSALREVDGLSSRRAGDARGGDSGGWRLARHVSIKRSGEDTKHLVMPVKGVEDSFENLELEAGDRLRVESVPERVISVIGLVNAPQTIDPPPGRRLTLLEVIARAEGLDRVADPQFVNIYRRANPEPEKASASTAPIVAARFPVSGLSGAKGQPRGTVELLKPGDVVAVESTSRTDMRQLIKEVVRLGVGVVYEPFN